MTEWPLLRRLRPGTSSRAATVIALLLIWVAGSLATTSAQATPLDDRVALMTKELGLSADQQGRLRSVLLSQREQLLALWNDTTIPAALRVSRTQSLADHTAEQIRALLSEEQRARYLQPRNRAVKVGTPGASVESWERSVRSP